MKRFTIGIILIFFITIVACSQKEDTTIEDVDELPKEVIDIEELEPEIEKKTYKNQFPLTGIGTNDDIDYRAFGVMIENSRAARPQSGLYQADLVYEVLAEGTITRLLAFYHSEKPEIIGPVRSARDYYIHLNNGYGAIYASAGGSPQAFAMVDSGQVDYINGLVYDGRYLWRSSDRRAPHNMYTSYENLIKAAEHARHGLISPVPALSFHKDDKMIEGEVADIVNISYGSTANDVTYQYDHENKNYLRFVGGEQSLDLETNIPVTTNNIFIVEMKHRVIDNQGRRDINLNSGGAALLVQNGVFQYVEWKNVNGQILPFKDGEKVNFLKGKTWINVVPNLDKSVSIN